MKARFAPALALCLLMTACRAERLPVSAHEALSRVNQNIERVKDPLVCKPAVVSFKFRDEQGKTQRFSLYPATIMYKSPRCLYFDIKSNFGESVARVGSNDDRFWIWIEPELNKMWWGEWSRLKATANRTLPIQPDQVLSALALQPLEFDSNNLPRLDLTQKFPRLIYRQSASDGSTFVSREVVLDRYEPCQPIRMIQRREDGRIVSDAKLDEYQRIGKDGPWTAREYVVDWPLNEAQMRLSIGGAKFGSDLPPFCTFPTNPPVAEVERIDGGAAAAAQSARGQR